MRVSKAFAACLVLVVTSPPLEAQDIVTVGKNLSVDVSPVDGRIATDLMGSLWTLPPSGGEASRLAAGMFPLVRPRWSPDGRQILYQAGTPDGSKLWVVDASGANATLLSGSAYHDQDASWHPDGERIVYASDRNDSGLDIWETDLATGLAWRITSHAGDETEPAWSASGRHLAYVRKRDTRYALVLRRHGEPEQELLVSPMPLSAPSWRPDGSLLTFLEHDGSAWTLKMAILSEPVLIRALPVNEDLIAAPVAWRDRMRMIYTADGRIKTRGFEDRRSRPLHFRAVRENAAARAPRTTAKKALAVIDPPDGRLVIRGSKLFDGVWAGYRRDMDVVIEAGRIAAVEPATRRDDAIVVDLGDVTIIPGLIDAWSALGDDPALGPALLAYGVTTIVADAASVSFDRARWEGEDLPGPRILTAADIRPGADIDPGPGYFLARIAVDPATPARARVIADAWREGGVPVIADSRATGMGIGADLLLGAALMVDGDIGGAPGNGQPFSVISGLADSNTPGMSALLASRQAVELGHSRPPGRRFGTLPDLSSAPASIVAGSKPNHLPPGLALHAELRALAAAGLSGEQVLHAAGRNAARVLGVSDQIGAVTPGALADLVLVAGDPLARVSDALKIVAVVRNGRFFSLVNLLERGDRVVGVE